LSVSPGFTGNAHAYDAVYGPVMKDLKSCGFRREYIQGGIRKYQAALNIDEVQDVSKVKEAIAKKLGITVPEMERNVEPLQALYAIADHSKTLLYAINDGGLLSNVGAAYKPAHHIQEGAWLIRKANLGIDLFSVCEKHAKYLKPMKPSFAGSASRSPGDTGSRGKEIPEHAEQGKGRHNGH